MPPVGFVLKPKIFYLDKSMRKAWADPRSIFDPLQNDSKDRFLSTEIPTMAHHFSINLLVLVKTLIRVLCKKEPRCDVALI
jgi:hypothetical protein